VQRADAPGGLATALALLGQKATAVIAYNDLMAIRVIKGMPRAGVHVPTTSASSASTRHAVRDHRPELTTVGAPLRAKGIIGVETLIVAVGGATPSRGPIVLPVRLVVRGSTGQRRRNRSSPARGSTDRSEVTMAGARLAAAAETRAVWC
jgi:DNA-binding LacI/PurR family transcriptional regulator